MPIYRICRNIPEVFEVKADSYDDAVAKISNGEVDDSESLLDTYELVEMIPEKIENPHTDACYRMPQCGVCERPKAPFGRDPGVMMTGSLCGHECPGYLQDPKPGHLWPDEKPEKD